MSRESACRSCGHPQLDLVLSLGQTPLANSLRRREDLDRPEPRFPLDLAFCDRCKLVQITETVPPEQLFRDYLYFSSFSETMLAHARELVGRLTGELALGSGALAMEIASNDGYLLQYYKQAGVPVLGIEPAQNVARVAVEERGIPTISEFFGLALARKLVAEGRRADVVHANNVLAHVADLGGFVDGIREVLKPDGVAALEFPYVGEMIAHTEFDTIYHEHLCYFSLGALVHLFDRHGLKAIGVERLPIHGGSLLLTVARSSSAREPAASVAALLEEERAQGMYTLEYYRGFARRVDELGQQLRALLGRLKQEGSRIAAYGAAAKGSTLLNTFGVGAETLDFVVDRNTHKQGLFMPGVAVPIVPPAQLVEKMPAYTLLLTWNFAEEILRQQAEYRRRGGKFIMPVPDVRIV
ncbi:MAG TPA: class I SAM-dependent methyltransferase [Polyangia bacterium]|nr:class I SAM-dependent methyltransferase [Polyangia bacterium]